MQAITDAVKGTIRQKQEVLDWIDTQDYDDVCHYAGITNEFLAQSIFDILAMPGAAATVKGASLRQALRAYDNRDTRDPEDEEIDLI